MTLDGRPILEALIGRLEPDVGEIVEWADCTPDEAVRGVMHLARALAGARAALASGDPDEIATAGLIWAGYERTGRKMATRAEEARRQQAAAQRRANGGRERAAQQSRAAAAIWQPWQARFLELVAAGKKAAEARRIIGKEMTRDGFTLPSTGAAPSERRMLDRLK